MIRRKKVSARANHTKHINNLPNNVIETILQLLPIQDLVKTSVLSREWRYKWASIPQLEFKNLFFEHCVNFGPFEISSIITEVLLLHVGPITNFSFCLPSNIPIKYECLNKWILFLSTKEIKFLELSSLQLDPFQTPSHIFSCQGLTHLELGNFKLSNVPNFSGFKSLVTLRLSDIKFESKALARLLFRCPSLVMLTILYCSGFECINISSRAFKVLHVQAIRVIKSICLEKAKNVTEISLIVEEPMHNFESDAVSDLIKGLWNVKSICLGEGYIKMFSKGFFPKKLERSLNYVTNLVLFGVNFNETRELQFVISLLKSTPNLEKLLIENYSNIMDVGPPHASEESKYDGFFLKELQKVDINVKNAFKNTLNFIRFLLANSPSLVILNFTISLAHDRNSISSIIQELKQMAQASTMASTKAEILFNYEVFIH